MKTSGQEQAPTDRRYVTADVYVKKAGITLSGRSLRRWCEANPHLANGLREIPSKGKKLYDADTAPRFREIWIDAERKKRAESKRLESEADDRFGPNEVDR